MPEPTAEPVPTAHQQAPQDAGRAQTLPVILSGPVLRHCSDTQLTLWLATSHRCDFHFQLFENGEKRLDLQSGSDDLQVQTVQLGQHCFIQLLTACSDTALPHDRYLEYDLLTDGVALQQHLPHLCYDNQQRPGFTLKSRLDNLLHGSCRKPHHPSQDGLLQVDKLLAESRTQAESCPALLLFSGDQIYADEVAGPTLWAIHQLIERLGLFHEQFEGATVDNTASLLQSPACYYQREKLLPDTQANQGLLEQFFTGAKKPIFTASGAHNHLICVSEVIAMYLLVWSPSLWETLDLSAGEKSMPEPCRDRYRAEQAIIEDFVEGLPRVQRALAHIPTYMIFDDHDVTDDWNLTRGWEDAAYNHPFSRRIIGNALIGYWLCQGWGNQPRHFTDLNQEGLSHFTDQGISQHDQLVDRLLQWGQWHYHLDTQPKLIVLDTRTHRWRSERNPNKPSGLMDWESLSALQQQMIGEDAVILVSAAPVFGVKLIEAVQRVFTTFGKPLMVDAENWMAHPGAANVILNIFRHAQTPPHFIIISGDVHYSFVYDITLRHRHHSPEILQVTASGIKNCFPPTLLRWFDRLNRWLYASRSPLNLFTKRRAMRIKRRQPSGGNGLLFNQSGIGQVLLSKEFEHIEAREISHNKTVEFIKQGGH